MRVMQITAALAIVATPIPALARKWIEYASREGRFTCNFPGRFVITETTSK